MIITVKSEAAKRGWPSIWYCEHPNGEFEVKKSDEWPYMYEVVSGEHIGKLIEKSAFTIKERFT